MTTKKLHDRHCSYKPYYFMTEQVDEICSISHGIYIFGIAHTLQEKTGIDWAERGRHFTDEDWAEYVIEEAIKYHRAITGCTEWDAWKYLVYETDKEYITSDYNGPGLSYETEFQPWDYIGPAIPYNLHGYGCWDYEGIMPF